MKRMDLGAVLDHPGKRASDDTPRLGDLAGRGRDTVEEGGAKRWRGGDQGKKRCRTGGLRLEWGGSTSRLWPQPSPGSKHCPVVARQDQEGESMMYEIV